jgi:peptidoglycan/LPS O-acetylase OafA/YrhL
MHKPSESVVDYARVPGSADVASSFEWLAPDRRGPASHERIAATGTPAKGHLAAMDGLRGLAVALVVWFHIWQITWLGANLPLLGHTFNFNVIPETGFVGVSLFFFISGFVIFYPYARTMFDGAPRQTTRTFYYRRLLKILPSYYFALVAMTALGMFSFSSQDDELRQLGFHALFIFGFFPDTIGSLNGVLWSLAVEMQFYLIFPAICWCAMRRPLATFATLTVIAIAYRALISHRNDVEQLIDQLPGVLDVFAAGMFAAFAYRGLAVRAPRLIARRRLWTLVGIGGLAACWWLIGTLYAERTLPHWPMDWWPLGRPALNVAFVLLTLGTLFALPFWQRIVANPITVSLSFVSYNLYIWHQMIAQGLEAAKIPGWTTRDQHSDPAWEIGFTVEAVALGLLVSWLITVLLEQPLLRWRPLQAFLTRARPPVAPLSVPAEFGGAVGN